MTTYFEIPLSPDPQTFVIALGGIEYRLRLTYQDADGGGWVIDLSDNQGGALVQGIPLVTGADLLEQYQYLGIGGALYVQGSPDPDSVPTFENLGNDSILFWAT
jgi:hypothetical protein